MSDNELKQWAPEDWAAATTKATSRLPHSSSGTPSTSASRTAGCSRSRRATAGAGTLTPPLTTTSSSRPSTCRRRAEVRSAKPTGNQSIS